MKSIYTLLFTLLAALPAMRVSAQAPPILWQKILGGDSADIMTDMNALSGGGMMLAGHSKSSASGDKQDTSRGGFDYWLVKLNETGTIAWEKTYGGLFDDTSSRIIKTDDGGYMLGGTSLSPGRTGDKIYNNWGYSPDYWVIKLDKNGQQVWQKDVGGTFTERLTGISQTDYGYALSGHSYSDVSGDKTSDNTGSENRADLWLMFLETSGKTKKTATYGTVGPEYSCCILSSNAGNVLGGYSYSRSQLGQKTNDPYGGCDYWVIRTDLSGTRIFDSSFGGTGSDIMTCMTSVHDGNIIIGGYSESDKSTTVGNKSEDSRGSYDYWMLKMNALTGKILWQKTIGGAGGDYMTSVQETHDGGFILGGYSASDMSGEKSENSKGGFDYWIVKTDSIGNVQWDKTYGGSGDDKLVGVAEYTTDQYILCGTSYSPQSGDKTSGTVGNTGQPDFWVIRLGKDTATTDPTEPPTDEPGSGEEPAGKYTLSIVQNPAPSTLTFKYSSVSDGENVTFALHSYDGKKLKTFTLNGTKQTQTYSLPVAKYPHGVYYLTMYNKGKKVTKMFVR